VSSAERSKINKNYKVVNLTPRTPAELENVLAVIQTARRYPLDQIVKILTSTRVTPEPSSNLSRLYNFRRTLFTVSLT